MTNRTTRLRLIPALALMLTSLSLPACDRTHAKEHGKEHGAEHGGGHEQHTVVLTSPRVQDVVVTQPYVCQIRSQRSTAIRSLQDGYLEAITIREGQAVKAGDELFRINPTLFKARLAFDEAEAKLARVTFEATLKLFNDKVVSVVEVNKAQAELDKATARVELARAELKFATVVAPFDGIIDRLEQQQGSLVKKEEVLTTLSDNRVMWVYFNVPEARYFEYKARQGTGGDPSRLELVNSWVELVLADGSKFPHRAANTVTVEGKFNSETGNIPFRADFPNPDALLRHGQTGTVLIHRRDHGAVVIPQRATFEFLDKRYVYVVGDDHVVHQRLITVREEQDDVFILKSGLAPDEKIVLDGVKQVSEGQKLDAFEYRKPDEVLKSQKHPAE